MHDSGRTVIEVVDAPSDDDLAAVDDALAAFTVAAAGHGAPRPLAVFARRGDSIVAGIHGWTWAGCCELVSLWVSEPQRGHGLGHALLTAAEDRARARGCHQVVLFTHAFQSPGLYTDSGYDLVGEVEDYPAGSAAYWFRKRLDAQPGAKLTRIAQATLGLGIAMLVASEAIDAARALRRRTAHRLADWWDDRDRRELREERRTELAALAIPIIRCYDRGARAATRPGGGVAGRMRGDGPRR